MEMPEHQTVIRLLVFSDRGKPGNVVSKMPEMGWAWGLLQLQGAQRWSRTQQAQTRLRESISSPYISRSMVCSPITA
jgi:hypothetical protein